MADDVIAPQGEPQGTPAPTPAPETAPAPGTEQAPPDGQAAPTPGDGAPSETPPAEKPKVTPWFQRRIDQLTAEKHEERRQKEALKATVETLMRGQPPQPAADGTPAAETPPATPPAATSDAEIDRRATIKAQEIQRAAEFNAACNRTFDAGKAEFPDFADARDQLVSGLGDVIQRKPEFLEAITALPDGHKVFHQLAKNLDDAARILDMPPVQMAIELAKLSGAPAKAKPVSSAPPPIKPIAGTARGEKDPNDMTTAEWMEWRKKTERKRR